MTTKQCNNCHNKYGVFIYNGKNYYCEYCYITYFEKADKEELPIPSKEFFSVNSEDKKYEFK